MEKIICTFNVLCVTHIFDNINHYIWHMEETGEAVVIEKTVTQGFLSNEGLEHPLVGLTYHVVKFRRNEYLLTGMLDGLDGMAVCLMVKALDGSNRLKLYTDTPTPVGETKEAVRKNARQTIDRSLSRGW